MQYNVLHYVKRHTTVLISYVSVSI